MAGKKVRLLRGSDLLCFFLWATSSTLRSRDSLLPEPMGMGRGAHGTAHSGEHGGKTSPEGSPPVSNARGSVGRG